MSGWHIYVKKVVCLLFCLFAGLRLECLQTAAGAQLGVGGRFSSYISYFSLAKETSVIETQHI